MSVRKCRVCRRPFFSKCLLQYKNMPALAQFLPSADELKKDKGVDINVCQCSGCGLVQLSNGPVHYYREVIRAVGVSPEMKSFRKKQFKRFVSQYSLRKKKVVEIGCGRGEYLSILKHAGAEPYGLEGGGESVAGCLKQGLRVEKGFVLNSAKKLRHAPFAGFVILNYLEHLPDPNTVLGGIRNNLADGAVGLVEVPNFDMIMKRNLFAEFTSDHLLYFTRETLQTALRLNGFHIIECKDIWHDYIISATVVKRGPLHLGTFDKHRLRLKKEIGDFLGRYGRRKVAIWGAGHQALAMLSLSGLSEKIRYVVDSAVFKQGRYTPATHVRIVPPESLVDDPVDAVIVMAASYSNEVASILRRKYGGGMCIAILRESGLEIC